MRWAVCALLIGCSFDHGASPVDSGAGGRDDSTPDMPAPDTPPCTLFVNVCAEAPPPEPFNLAGPDTINTDTDPRCRTVVQPSGGPVCLVYATAVDLGAASSLAATGSRPLAIASASTMIVAGTIDVSSKRGMASGPAASSSLCGFASAPDEDAGGAGGGAGGTFGLHGGNGGTGDTDSSVGTDGVGTGGTAGAPATIASLRGGCRGQTGGNESAIGGAGGAGGDSGGALYLYAAERIVMNGAIRATGAGGTGGQVQAGGGGGGSGGLVVIESPSIMITGQISANGGGGGEGGARVGGSPVVGQPGADGTMGTTPAPGGMGTDNRFGYGGAGGASTIGAAGGVSSIIGGGGGGGGVGIVKLIGSASTTGIISPPPM